MMRFLFPSAESVRIPDSVFRRSPIRYPVLFPLLFFGSLFAAQAQDDYLLPFSLQVSLNETAKYSLFPAVHPAITGLYAESKGLRGFAGTYARTGFIKENGRYGLTGGIMHQKNAWTVHYSYQGYSLLNRQEAGAGYARNFLPGLSAGLNLSYRTGNRIENRKRESLLEIGLSSAFRTGIWAFGFGIRHPVALYSAQSKEWNRALSLRIGAACRLYQELHVGIDLYKDLRYPLQAGIGFGYLFRKIFLLYAQVQINPTRYKLGFGYHGRVLNLEIAASYQNPIGFTSCISLTWKQLFSKPN